MSEKKPLLPHLSWLTSHFTVAYKRMCYAVPEQYGFHRNICMSEQWPKIGCPVSVGIATLLLNRKQN